MEWMRERHTHTDKRKHKAHSHRRVDASGVRATMPVPVHVCVREIWAWTRARADENELNWICMPNNANCATRRIAEREFFVFPGFRSLFCVRIEISFAVRPFVSFVSFQPNEPVHTAHTQRFGTWPINHHVLHICAASEFVNLSARPTLHSDFCVCFFAHSDGDSDDGLAYTHTHTHRVYAHLMWQSLVVCVLIFCHLRCPMHMCWTHQNGDERLIVFFSAFFVRICTWLPLAQNKRDKWNNWMALETITIAMVCHEMPLGIRRIQSNRNIHLSRTKCLCAI